MTQNSRILSFDQARKGASRRRASDDLYAGLDYYGERYGSPRLSRGASSGRLADGSRGVPIRLAQTTRSRGSMGGLDVGVQRGGKSSADDLSRFSRDYLAASDSAQDEDFQLSAKEQRARNREQVKRSRAKAKAEKAFSKQYGGMGGSSVDDAGPRAAVYEGKMGSNHKKAARLQTPDAAARGNFGFSPFAAMGAMVGSLASWLTKPRSAVAASVIVCLLLTAGFLYPSARTCYQAIREEARLELEYAALDERNRALASNVAYLQTDAGVEARARSQYGWVKEGEQAGSVSGVDAVQEDPKIAAKVMSDEIKPPTTWYSPVLDPLFGVDS